MSTGREPDRVRCEFEHNLLECLRGIGNANLRGINRLCEILRNKNGRCAGFAEQPDIFSICEEADFSRCGFAEGCRAGDLQRRVADYFATGLIGQLLKSQTHREDGKRRRICEPDQMVGTNRRVIRFLGAPSGRALPNDNSDGHRFEPWVQRGGRFSMNACTPSSAASSIMLHAMI